MSKQTINRAIRETDETVKVWDVAGKPAHEWQGSYEEVKDKILANLETYSELFHRDSTGKKTKKSPADW